MGKPFYSKADVQKADEIDIHSLLIAQGQQTKRQGKEQVWVSPEGYKIGINGNQWFSHYEKIGGYTVSFVRRFFHLDMYGAMKMLLGEDQQQVQLPKAKVSAEKEKLPFKPPPRNDTSEKAKDYLCNKRLIAPPIVEHFLANGSIYETKELIGNNRVINNLALCGMNTKGEMKQVHIKGMGQSGFRRNAEGSDPHYGFRHIGKGNTLFVFESAIDLMSYLTIVAGNTPEWMQFSYVALDGTSEHALLRTLEDNPQIKDVVLDLDHDIPGMEATRRLTWILWEHGYTNISVECPPGAKDWNEILKKMNGLQSQPAIDYPHENVYLNQCDLILKTANDKDFFKGNENDIENLAGHIRECWELNKNGIVAHELKTVGAYAYNLARRYMHSMQDSSEHNCENMLRNGYTPELTKKPKSEQIVQFQEVVKACGLTEELGAVRQSDLYLHVENLLKLAQLCATQNVELMLRQEVAPCMTMG